MFGIFRKRVVTGCGHKSEKKGYIEVLTNKGIKKIHVFTDNKYLPVCIDCYKRAIIKCCRCGEPIFLGNPITLQKIDDPVSDDFVEHPTKKGHYISCMRIECISNISKFRGYLSKDSKIITLEYINYHLKSDDFNLENFF